MWPEQPREVRIRHNGSVRPGKYRQHVERASAERHNGASAQQFTAIEIYTKLFNQRGLHACPCITGRALDHIKRSRISKDSMPTMNSSALIETEGKKARRLQ